MAGDDGKEISDKSNKTEEEILPSRNQWLQILDILTGNRIGNRMDHDNSTTNYDWYWDLIKYNRRVKVETWEGNIPPGFGTIVPYQTPFLTRFQTPNQGNTSSSIPFNRSINEVGSGSGSGGRRVNGSRVDGGNGGNVGGGNDANFDPFIPSNLIGGGRRVDAGGANEVAVSDDGTFMIDAGGDGDGWVLQAIHPRWGTFNVLEGVAVVGDRWVVTGGHRMGYVGVLQSAPFIRRIHQELNTPLDPEAAFTFPVMEWLSPMAAAFAHGVAAMDRTRQAGRTRPFQEDQPMAEAQPEESGVSRKRQREE